MKRTTSILYASISIRLANAANPNHGYSSKSRARDPELRASTRDAVVRIEAALTMFRIASPEGQIRRDKVSPRYSAAK
jgi:hypothetical protein